MIFYEAVVGRMMSKNFVPFKTNYAELCEDFIQAVYKVSNYTKTYKFILPFTHYEKSKCRSRVPIF
jgi:hypothetical protein